jgi:serine phosphatase RsbU (regulator of sigma subunit)
MSIRQSWDYASLIKPCLGEHLSGDAVMIQPLKQELFVALVDVLGHGPEAHKLTLLISEYFSRYASSDLIAVMSGLHQYLRGSRGAAVGLCTLNSETGCITYVGIGNTVFRRFGSTDSRLVSQDGVLGQNMRTPRPQTLKLETDDMVLLYTDGVSDRFTQSDYPSLLIHSPSLVSSNIISRYGKGYDDAACIAIRYVS